MAGIDCAPSSPSGNHDGAVEESEDGDYSNGGGGGDSEGAAGAAGGNSDNAGTGSCKDGNVDYIDGLFKIL